MVVLWITSSVCWRRIQQKTRFRQVHAISGDTVHISDNVIFCCRGSKVPIDISSKCLPEIGVVPRGACSSTLTLCRNGTRRNNKTIRHPSCSQRIRLRAAKPGPASLLLKGIRWVTSATSLRKEIKRSSSPETRYSLEGRVGSSKGLRKKCNIR